MMEPYGTCKKCGKAAVHLAMNLLYEAHGDSDDDCGNESIYADETIEFRDPLDIGVHVCFECGAIEDFWFENPRHPDETEIKRLEARVAALEEALRPFACAYCDWRESNNGLLVADIALLTLDHYKAAAAALGE